MVQQSRVFEGLQSLPGRVHLPQYVPVVNCSEEGAKGLAGVVCITLCAPSGCPCCVPVWMISPPLILQEMSVGYANGIRVMSITHTGEPGFMLYIPIEVRVHGSFS